MYGLAAAREKRNPGHQNIVIVLVFEDDMYQELRVLRYGSRRAEARVRPESAWHLNCLRSVV